MKETPELSPLKRAFLALEETKAKLAAAEQAVNAPIAVIGVGCRFPGDADTPDAFWRLLSEGRDAIIETPPDRWDLDALFDPDPEAPGKMYTRWGGFLSRVDQFDAPFFGIAPREAMSMDPQQRLLLEVSWEALEHAGQAPDGLSGSATGVFVGICTSDYGTLQLKYGSNDEIDLYKASGSAHSIASGRLSYVMGLQGPSVSIDTACSSSLVAVHLACQSLRTKECRMALAGGVHLLLSPDNTISFCKSKMLAADGHCKTFDAKADGFAEGEGCGIVVLKRLADAEADGDRILAVIRGSAVNQDGPSSGLTAPNGPAQEAVVRTALQMGRVEPRQVGYIEAHGTGTSLGDPMELRALGNVLGEGRAAGQPVLVGSVKTNFGHLEAAAGVAGLIKVVLTLQHDTIPPHLHFDTPNPYVPWSELPVSIVTKQTPWPAGASKIAGVSAFGFSGTNAHLVLEEAPVRRVPPPAADRPLHVFTLSARSGPALAESARRWAAALAAQPADGGDSCADICFTANAGRAQFAHRAAFTAASTSDLVSRLTAIAAGDDRPDVLRGKVSPEPPRIAFLFTGQGSQHVGMAKALYDTLPSFRRTIDACDGILAGLTGRSIRELMHGGDEQTLNQTEFAQPALFALEYALAELWRSWGVEPVALIGHSLGEYVAACVAGVFNLEDGLKLVAARGRLMQTLCKPGAMAAVAADEASVQAAIAGKPGLAIAAVNAPDSVVISGDFAAVDAMVAELGARGIQTDRLAVSHAFHSPLMEPMLDEFERVAASIRWSNPRLRVVSNLTGDIARAELATPGYWRRHILGAVRFSDGIQKLKTLDVSTFVEIGPRPTLSGLGRRSLPDESLQWLPSLRKGRDDWSQILDTVGRLFTAGAGIDWRAFDRDFARKPLPLPTYPFERQRHWVDLPQTRPRPASAPAGRVHPLLGRRLRSASADVQFESLVDLAALPFLADHAKAGTVIFPATGILEMGAAAAEAVFGAGSHAVNELTISDPLVLSPDEPVVVQTIVTAAGGDAAAMRLFSRPESAPEEAEWRLHASATLRRSTGSPEVASLSMADVRAVHTQAMDVDEYYGRMQADGHDYGPSFHAISELSRSASGALALVELPGTLQASASEYAMHPVLVDAAMQTIGAAIAVENKEEDGGPEAGTYVPVSLDHFSMPNVRRGVTRAWSVVRLKTLESAADAFVADVDVLDDQGARLVAIEGVCLKRVDKSQLRRASRVATWLYEPVWQESADVASAEQPVQNGAWVILGSDGPLTAGIASRLESRGATTSVVSLAGAYSESPDARRFGVRPDDREAFARAFARVAERSGPIRGVVHLWNAEAVTGELSFHETEVRGTAGLMHAVLALPESDDSVSARIWIVTRGAQPTGDGPTSAGLRQSPAIGLARAIAAEQPATRCGCVDLDPAASDHDADQVLREIASSSGETQVAYRAGRRLVQRLVRVKAATPAHDSDRPVELQIAEPGVLDRLVLQPASRRAPANGEVEVEVLATGLNFRDVLNALAMYEGPPGPLGAECVGRVSAVGPGVTGVAAGDRVLTMSPGTFRSYITLPAANVFPVPRNLSVEEAATIPVAFLTAEYALQHLAHMSAGDKVLIHAAAGGVGLAAVQLAQRAGAEIYATVGSPAKRAYLESIGVRHILNSRSLQFADDVMALTGGKGVDIVLNSLAGDFIERSLAVLRQGGRFLELGKSGIWTAERVAATRPDVAYHAIYLGEAEAPVVRELFPKLLAGFESGALRPLPHREFRLSDAVSAFRFMAQARHIGKIVIVHDRARLHDDAPSQAGEGAYLVTGAFGGLGPIVSRWLVARGARHLVLAARSKPSPASAAVVGELEAAGARVSVVQADIANEADVRRLFETIDESMPPLRGVIHAAGVIDDGLLLEQDWSRFERVLAPKTAGAWALHRETEGRPLDFFVMFSSMVSVFGGAGQANYSAANAYLDALAHYRKAHGLPALSVNWGPWAEAGMAARLDSREHRRWAQQGISSMESPLALEALDRLLASGLAQGAVLPIDWNVVARSWRPGAEPALVRDLASVRPGAAASVAPPVVDLREELARAMPSERVALVRHRVVADALRILGVTGLDAIEPRQPLSELGLDSLMAVELRNALGAAVGRTLPATLLFRHPTVEALTAFLAHDILSLDKADGAGQAEAAQPDVAQAAVAALEDEEVKRLLNEELELLSSSEWTRREN